MSATVRLEAPAKLTLTLRVTGVRADGYHLIDAEMVSLALADHLVIAAADTTELTIDGPTSSGLDAADNLVTKALDAVGRTARVALTKRIPHGGGLGGGSADAAAVLRWAGLDIDDAADLALAAGLGADVPFCVRGGRARVQGIGDVLTALPVVERTVTVATPDFGCNTAAVYRAWDDLGGPTADGPNDLEPAALRVEPRLAAFRDALGDATGVTPHLAGSGSTWWLDGAHPGPGRIVTHTIPAMAVPSAHG